MKDKIVVATDFSEASMVALGKAIYLSKKLKCTLDIVHVVEYSLFRDSKKDKKAGKEALMRFVSKNYPNPEIEINQFCYVGTIQKELSKHIEESDAKLLCIGARGENQNLSDILLGSVARKIIRKSSIPVLVVKNESLSDYANIFSPTDFSDNSLALAKMSRKIFVGAKFIFYHLIARPFEIRLGHYGANDEEISKYNRSLEEKAKAQSKKFLNAFSNKTSKAEMVLDSGILSYTRTLSVANNQNASLIALPTTGKVSFFALDIVENSSLDVLVWRFNA